MLGPKYRFVPSLLFEKLYYDTLISLITEAKSQLGLSHPGRLN